MKYAWGICCNDEKGEPFLAYDGEREERRPMIVSKEIAEYRAHYINNPLDFHVAMREAFFQGLGAAPPEALAVPLPWIVNDEDIWSD